MRYTTIALTLALSAGCSRQSNNKIHDLRNKPKYEPQPINSPTNPPIIQPTKPTTNNPAPTDNLADSETEYNTLFTQGFAKRNPTTIKARIISLPPNNSTIENAYQILFDNINGQVRTAYFKFEANTSDLEAITEANNFFTIFPTTANESYKGYATAPTYDQLLTDIANIIAYHDQ